MKYRSILVKYFKNMKRLLLFTMVLLFVVLFTLSTSCFGQSTWVAPKEADAIENPLSGDGVVSGGKKLFDKMCVICHGLKGKGDGIAGAGLTPRPTNLAVQDQSEGVIYWKLTEGNPPMASYKGILSDEERWKLVSYIKSLKKK